MTPFYANYGFHPNTEWERQTQTENPASKIFGHWLTKTHQRAKDTLQQTRDKMAKYYDQKRKVGPTYNEGDLVRLNAKNIRTRRPSKKLAPKFYGPFKILKQVGKGAYALELNKGWRIHNVFHESLLEPYKPNTLDGRPQTLPTPEEIEGEVEYEVEKIVRNEIRETERRSRGRKIKSKSLWYLVKWRGYPEDECTWEPAQNITHADEEMELFHKQNPEAPVLEL